MLPQAPRRFARVVAASPRPVAASLRFGVSELRPLVRSRVPLQAWCVRFVPLAMLLALCLPATAGAVVCDGSEILCLDLTAQAQVNAAGGTVVGGSFSGAGFAPSNNGGIDFDFGPEVDFSVGSIEFDVEGLQPLDGEELSGGKVSLFTFCGEGAGDDEYIGFQKMAPDYRDGHIFRYGMDDDGLADNWDSVVITGSGFNCYYSINDPPWTADQTHHIQASWGPTGLDLDIDDGAFGCSKPGNGDTFDPDDKLFVVGNRCQHYSNQQPIASIRNLRLWGTWVEEPTPTPEPEPPCDGELIQANGIEPADGAGPGAVFQARYGHCLGAETFRIVQLMVADEVTDSDPNVHVAWSEGALHYADQSCDAGSSTVLEGPWGALDCARSAAFYVGNELVVDFAIDFDTDTFAGEHLLWFDAKGGPGDPEPRLGWTAVGTFSVEPDPEPEPPDDDDSVDVPLDDDDATIDPADADPATEDAAPAGDAWGCSCQAVRARPAGLLLLVLLPRVRRRR